MASLEFLPPIFPLFHYSNSSYGYLFRSWNTGTRSDLIVNRTLKELGLHKRTFYNWYARYLQLGYDGLAPKAKGRRQTWNKIPAHECNRVVEEALEHETLSSRELAAHMVDKHKRFISESSVYRILKARGLITAPSHIVLAAADEFTNKTTRINEMWQTAFTYFKIIGWGWYYLSTVLDDFSRYIISWELRANMASEDVKPSIRMALARTGLTKNTAPRLLSDNGPCYISSEIRSFFKSHGIKPVNGKACHPQTEGKIEHYHRTMKNVIKLENYYTPEQLRGQIEAFIDYYNNRRYHESLGNLTPADVYYGRAEQILRTRREVKQKTIAIRRKAYLRQKFNKIIQL